MLDKDESLHIGNGWRNLARYQTVKGYRKEEMELIAFYISIINSFNHINQQICYIIDG